MCRIGCSVAISKSSSAEVLDLFLRPHEVPCYSAWGTGSVIDEPLKYVEKDGKVGQRVVQAPTIEHEDGYTVIHDLAFVDEPWTVPPFPEVKREDDQGSA